MKKFKAIIFLVVIALAVFLALPAKADHRFLDGNQFANHYGGYYNHPGAWNNRFHNPYGYYPRRHGHRPYGGWRNNRNNDLAGIIIGGIIINEIFRNNDRRRYQRQTCQDVRRSGYDQNGNQVIYYERICN